MAAHVHTSSVRDWLGGWLVGRGGAGADFAAGWIPAGARAPTGLLLPPDPAGGLPIVRAQPHPHPPTLVTNTLLELLVNLWVSARFRNPPSFPARRFEEEKNYEALMVYVRMEACYHIKEPGCTIILVPLNLFSIDCFAH